MRTLTFERSAAKERVASAKQMWSETAHTDLRCPSPQGVVVPNCLRRHFL